MSAHTTQVGDYMRGRREGYGVYVFPNGDRYEGECSGDLPDGHGVYRFQVSGAICEGTWRAGAKHGWFVITVGCKQSCGALPALILILVAIQIKAEHLPPEHANAGSQL